MGIYLLFFLFLFGCQAQQADQSNEIKNYGDIIGKSLLCPTDQGEAQLFIYSPHVIGVPSLEKDYEIEYFRSEFAKSDGSVYLVSSMWGDKYYGTTRRKQDTPLDELRRIRITITTDKKIRVLVAQGIQPDSRTPIKPMEFYCKIGPSINEYHRSPR